MLIKRLLAIFLAAFVFQSTALAEDGDDGLVVGGDGLHKQEWFLDSFLEFGDDLADAAAEGKHLMIVIEQDGCPYCRELHRVNFKREEIVSLIKEHFVVVQLDLYGSRETVDFDGEELEERDLVAKWGAFFTPTTLIFTAEKDGATTWQEAETFRLPGYLKPFHYITSLEFVVSGAYKETDFQRYLKAKILALVEQGIEPDVW